MTDFAKTPMLYRFDGGSSTYGPKDLKWVIDVYGQRPDCSAAPADEASSEPAWLPVAAWVQRYTNSPLTQLQATRLRNLGIPFDLQHTTTSEASDLIRSADQAKPPTPALVKKAKALGVEVPKTATRASLDALIEEAELRQVALELTARGAKLPAVFSKQAAYEFREALESLQFSIEQAQERGLKPSAPSGLDLDQIRHLSQALDQFWSVAGDMADDLREMRELGYFSKMPSKAALTRVLPFLFDLILSGKWGTGNATWLEVVRRAETLEAPDGAG